jgi:hypothetical protein
MPSLLENRPYSAGSGEPPGKMISVYEAVRVKFDFFLG